MLQSIFCSLPILFLEILRCDKKKGLPSNNGPSICISRRKIWRKSGQANFRRPRVRHARLETPSRAEVGENLPLRRLIARESFHQRLRDVASYAIVSEIRSTLLTRIQPAESCQKCDVSKVGNVVTREIWNSSWILILVRLHNRRSPDKQFRASKQWPGQIKNIRLVKNSEESKKKQTPTLDSFRIKKIDFWRSFYFHNGWPPTPVRMKNLTFQTIPGKNKT